MSGFARNYELYFDNVRSGVLMAANILHITVSWVKMLVMLSGTQGVKC